MFYNNYVKLCKSVGKTPSAVAVEIGIGKSNVTYWKQGRNNPTDITLEKIADYFGVSKAQLTGEEVPKNEENPTSQKTGEVDEVTMELLDIIQNGSDADRQDMLDMLRIFNKRREKR